MHRVPLELPKSNRPINQLKSDLQKLNEKKNLTDEERWREFHHIFNAYFTLSKPSSFIASPSLALTPKEDKDSEVFRGNIIAAVIQSLPKSFQIKGNLLLDFIAHTPEVLNKRLEISPTGSVHLEGQEIANLVDLVHYALRSQKSLSPPKGWDAFLTFLRKNNIPDNFLIPKHWSSPSSPSSRSSSPLISITHSDRGNRSVSITPRKRTDVDDFTTPRTTLEHQSRSIKRHRKSRQPRRPHQSGDGFGCTAKSRGGRTHARTHYYWLNVI